MQDDGVNRHSVDVRRIKGLRPPHRSTLASVRMYVCTPHTYREQYRHQHVRHARGTQPTGRMSSNMMCSTPEYMASPSYVATPLSFLSHLLCPVDRLRSCAYAYLPASPLVSFSRPLLFVKSFNRNTIVQNSDTSRHAGRADPVPGEPAGRAGLGLCRARAAGHGDPVPPGLGEGDAELPEGRARYGQDVGKPRQLSHVS